MTGRVRSACSAYYGEAFVENTAYIAGYEPIRDASGSVIGVYATGYLKR